MTSQIHRKWSDPLLVSGIMRAKLRDNVFLRDWPKWIAVATVIACFGQDVSALDCQQRIGDEPHDDCRQTVCGSNDYCRKPIPCFAPPKMTSCPENYCDKPTPCITVPAESRCPDDYCSKPVPELCYVSPFEIEPAPRKSTSKFRFPQPCRGRPRPNQVVGGEACRVDDYCRKPLPCLKRPD